jgi:hypothetical protein
LIWLVRIPALIVVLLIANLAAALAWAGLKEDFKLDWIAFDGIVIWFISIFAISVSVLAFVPAVIAVIVAQRRQITSPAMYAYAGAAINAGAYYVLKGIVMWTLGPDSGLSYPHPVLELLCTAGAGLFVGVVYWLLAGRKRARTATTA